MATNNYVNLKKFNQELDELLEEIEEEIEEGGLENWDEEAQKFEEWLNSL